MIGINKHIIKRQVIDVDVPDKYTGSEVQDRISKMYSSIIIPIIDDVFCDLNLTDEIIRIDQLELDLGSLRIEHLADDLRVQLKSKLEDELVKIVYRAKNKIAQKGVEIRKIPIVHSTNENPQLEGQTITSTEISGYNDFSIFEEYLTTGLIPWWSTEKQKGVSQLFQTVIDKEWRTKEVKRVISLLRFKNVRHRLINNLKDKDLTILFSKLYSKKGKEALVLGSEIHRLIGEVDRVSSMHKFVRIKILDVLIKELILSKSTPRIQSDIELATSVIGRYLLKNFDAPYTSKFLAEVKKLKEWKFAFGKKEDFIKSMEIKLEASSKSLEVLKKKETNRIADSLDQNSIIKTENLESLIIGNAGLVILWPYLEIFFKELGLLDEEKQFVSESNKWRAIQLLHYLSYGTEEAEESELTLNKLICNLPIESSVPLKFELSDEDKLECENLLGAVLKNWKALKSSSIEGLRQSFIIRDGVFSNDQSGWTLSIERKSYDLLLDKLSWPISVIKFPWNTNLIHVRW